MTNSRKIIDLSMLIKEGMQTFCAHWHPVVEITQLGRHGIENRETRKLIFGTHTGTHVDSPRHFIEDGETIENIPLDLFVGEATVLDFSTAQDFQEITVQDLEKKIANRPLKRLIVRFDWDLKALNTHRYYSDHPYLSEEACEWLVKNGCKLLALDTPQPDNPKNGRGAEKDAPNHKILLGNQVILVEYLTNICKITNPIVELVVAPLKIANGDGAPARCFAIET